MKKTQVALAALALVASTAVLADGVKLYGTADASIVRTDNGTALAGAGNNAGTIYGMTGSEDLGNGLKAGFTMEGGIDLANGVAANGGTSNQGFNRQTFVSVGTNDATVSFGMKISPFISGALNGAGNIGGNGVFVPGLLRLTGGNLAGMTGSAVSGGFFIPDAINVDANFGGISTSIMYRAAHTGNDYQAASASGTFGGLNLTVAYQRIDVSGVSTKNTVLAGNTKFGDVTVHGAIGQGTGTNANDGYVIGAHTPVAAGLEAGVYYAYSSATTLDSQTSLSLKYTMSPRTFAYFTYNAFGVSTATTMNNDATLANDQRKAMIVGVAHSF